MLTATIAPTAAINNAPGGNNNKSTNSNGISHGAIAGIVVGVVVGVVLLTMLLLWFCGITLLCIPGRNRNGYDDDDEKSIRDDSSMSIHHAANLHDTNPGSNGYGRTPAYLYNADEISIGRGNRRFSQSSLPDAAAGSDTDNSGKGGGLRVINPDLSDAE